jgi:hypothetical protein
MAAAIMYVGSIAADRRTWDNGSADSDRIKDVIHAVGLGNASCVTDVRIRDQHFFMSSSFVNDTEPPILSVISPSSGETIKTSTVTISWEGIDNASGIAYYKIAVDNDYLMSVGLNTSYTVTRLTDGRHFVKIGAFDKAGNASYELLSFMVNTGVERFSWPPHVAEVVVAIVLVITLGIAVYVLKSWYPYRTKKPGRRLVR